MQEEILTPSYHGESCRHNGENDKYELACDECPYYLLCFPDWKYLEENFGFSDDRSYLSMKTSSIETLEAYLSANAMATEPSTKEEADIIWEVKKELEDRKDTEKKHLLSTQEL